MENFYKAKGKPVHVGREDFEPTSLMEIAMKRSTAVKQFSRYKVVQCPSCGEPQITEAQKLECVYCKHIALFRVRHRWNVNLIQTNDFKKAKSVCALWKAMKGINKETTKEDVVRRWLEIHRRKNGKENTI